jgi:hypothetical protein
MDSSDSPSRVDSGNRPHTDSMVTVPLSDAQSNSDPSHPDWSSPNTPQTPAGGFSAADDQRDATQPGNGALGSESDLEQVRATGPSIRLPETDGMHQADDAEGDVVDWAELEKTEEQEPRGEQSDEVRICPRCARCGICEGNY